MLFSANPESLSKERLKAELKKKGIKFNASENKSYYVDLYRKRVLNEDPTRGEFSSDDELRQSPRVTGRKAVSPYYPSHIKKRVCEYCIPCSSPYVAEVEGRSPRAMERSRSCPTRSY